LAHNLDFAYDGHLTNDATWDIPRQFKEAGYQIHLVFFGLTDTELSEIRVVARSQEGGHYVDPSTVAANFAGNLEKLDKHFRMFDTIQLIDTSEADHILLTILNNGEPTYSIPFNSLPDWFTYYLPEITIKLKAISELSST
jgi:predicted ABC-type ATPase